MVEIKEIRLKKASELKDLIAEKQKELLNYRFQKAQGALKSPTMLKMVRRDIARLKTVLGQNQEADKRSK
jgi:large subunit ribosomal protein L29